MAPAEMPEMAQAEMVAAPLLAPELGQALRQALGQPQRLALAPELGLALGQAMPSSLLRGPRAACQRMRSRPAARCTSRST